MSLRELVEEVAEVDWWDPAWWAVIGGATLVEALRGRRGADVPYLISDAEPATDTFLGWAAPAPRGLAAAIADAVADAAAAAAALDELDGTLPDQPLRVALAAGAGPATTTPADPAVVRFSIGGRRRTVRLGGDLAAAARAVAGPGGDGDAAPAAIAAEVGDHDPAIARHLPRRCWQGGGGPWLGLGRAGGLAIASTSHLVVDGHGHTLIAARIAAARGRDGVLRERLARAAAEVVGDAPVPAAPPLAGAAPLGLAWRRIDGPLPRFTTLAHALGVTLHADDGDPAARFSPVLQVPVARGDRDDPDRFRRRVVHTLLSVRFADGRPEPVEDFAARARAAFAREVAGDGLLSRLVAATAAVPVPMTIKRRRMVGARSPRFEGPLSVCAGRAVLSMMPAPAGAPPLVAVSAPAWTLPPDDPRATAVFTIVPDDRGATITCAGTGAASTPDGAGRLLDRWLARVRLATAGVLAIALVACGSPPPPEAPAAAHPERGREAPESKGAPPDEIEETLAILGALGEPGPATDEVLEDDMQDHLLAETPAEPEEAPEIVLDLATGQVSGGPSWLEDPIARRRGAFQECARKHHVRDPFRATIVLDERGRVTEVIGAEGEDGDRCMGKALRVIRFEVPSDTVMPDVYLRLEQ